VIRWHRSPWPVPREPLAREAAQDNHLCDAVATLTISDSLFQAATTRTRVNEPLTTMNALDRRRGAAGKE
jgi:hypothetical protein